VEVVEDLGILVGHVDSAEALATDWRGDPPPVDVVRVDRPPAAGWAALTAAGFSVKPRLLLWAANAWPSEEAYLAALGKGERYMMRSARRMFEGQGLTTVVAPVDEALVTDFLALYWRQVSAMTRGWLVAVEQRMPCWPPRRITSRSAPTTAPPWSAAASLLPTPLGIWSGCGFPR
jgi:hypothetical protein